MNPISSHLTTPSPSTASTIPVALQHSPSPPPVHRNSGPTAAGRATAAQRSKASPLRRTSGHKVAGGTVVSSSASPPGTREALERKDEVKRLAQRLATRLQYAAFKVERGWTKHTLPEVENLYWRATKVGSSTTITGTAGLGSSSSSRKLQTSQCERGGVNPDASSNGSTRESRDARGSQRSGAEEDAAAVTVYGSSGSRSESARGVEEDVFGSSLAITRSAPVSSSSSDANHKHHPQTVVIGLNGLPTPPPSAGTEVAQSANASSSKGLLADLRVSPTRQMQAARAIASVNATGRGMAIGAEAGTGVGVGGGGSYADFWSTLGSSPARGVKRRREGVGEPDEESV